MLKTNKIIITNYILLVFLVLGGLFYILLLNDNPIFNYELRIKESNLESLKIKNQTLKLELAELNSLKRIEVLAKNDGMIGYGEIAWLKDGKDVALR